MSLPYYNLNAKIPWNLITKGFVVVDEYRGEGGERTLPIPLANVKEYLRLPTEEGWTENDVTLTDLIWSVTDFFEEKADLSIVKKKWRLEVPALPMVGYNGQSREGLRLERPSAYTFGVTDVEVSYWETDEEEITTLATGEFHVSNSKPPVVIFPSGSPIYSARLQDRPDAVQCTFVAGTELMREETRKVVQQLIAYQYRNPEVVVHKTGGNSYENMLSHLVSQLAWRA